MDPSLTALVGVVIGGLTTAVAEWLRTRSAFKRDKGWQRLEDRKHYLQQIYEAADSQRMVYIRGGATALAKVTGMNAPFGATPEPPQTTRLRMLVHLHAPQLLPPLNVLEGATLEYVKPLSALMAAEPEKRNDVMNNVIFPALTTLVEAHEAFLSQVAQEVSRVDAEARDLS